MQEGYEAEAIPTFEGEFGSNVILSPTDDTTSMAQIRAEAGGDSTYDVVQTLGTPMIQMSDEDLLQSIDVDDIPNLEHVDEELQYEFAVPNFYSNRAIVYNADAVGEDPPESWADLWDPRFEGRVGIESSHEMDWLFAAAAATKGSPPETDEEWDAGWDMVAELPDQARIYGEDVSQAFNSGEIWMFMGSLSSARDLNQDSSMEVAGVIPEEGSWMKTDLSVIPKNTTNLDGAHNFLNTLLSPESQRAIFEHSGYIPATTNADISQEEYESVAGDADAQERTVRLDEEYLTENADDWRERWQQEVLQQ